MLNSLKHRIRYNWDGWRAERKVRPGDIYEDCRYHPMLCVENWKGDLTGISLITGQVGCCSYFHCGVRKMDATTAYRVKKEWK